MAKKGKKYDHEAWLKDCEQSDSRELKAIAALYRSAKAFAELAERGPIHHPDCGTPDGYFGKSDKGICCSVWDDFCDAECQLVADARRLHKEWRKNTRRAIRAFGE